MLINCVAYENGHKHADISIADIGDWLGRPGCFVWVALQDPDGAELAQMQEKFDLHELAARLRALVRRAHGQSEGQLSAGPVVLDPAAHQVWCNGAVVELSVREYDLLHALLLNAGRVLSREQLEQRLYPWGSEINSNAVEVHICQLRRKLGAALIETVTSRSARSISISAPEGALRRASPRARSLDSPRATSRTATRAASTHRT